MTPPTCVALILGLDDRQKFFRAAEAFAQLQTRFERRRGLKSKNKRCERDVGFKSPVTVELRVQMPI